jgi:hypothetical protein
MKNKEKYINLEDARAKKTIFGTTEKSNFILNMRIEQVDKLAFWVIVAAFTLSTIGTFLTEFFKEINELPMMCFAVAGVAAMVLSLVVYQKRLYSRKVLAPVLVYGVIFILAIVSAVLSTDIIQSLKNIWHDFLYPQDNYFLYDNFNIALKGFPGRGEGLFTLFCYICFFLIAIRLSHSEKYVRKLLDFFVIVGLFQCLCGLLQIIPHISKALNFQYKDLLSVITYGVYLPNGASASPIIFANFLAILTPITIINASKNSKRKIFYTIATFFFVFFMLKTQTLMGIIGTAVSVLILLFFARKKLIVIVTALAVVLGVSSCFLFSSYRLYDTGIIWDDSFIRLEASGYLKLSAAPFDKYSTVETYQYLWKETAKVAAETPQTFMFGIGEEQLALAQADLPSNLIPFSINNFDKPYNDLLYIFATRGIFAVFLYFLFLAIAFKRTTSKTLQKRICVVCCSVYLFLSLLSFSAIETTPLFFVLLGLAWKNFENKGSDNEISTAENIDIQEEKITLDT